MENYDDIIYRMNQLENHVNLSKQMALLEDYINQLERSHHHYKLLLTLLLSLMIIGCILIFYVDCIFNLDYLLNAILVIIPASALVVGLIHRINLLGIQLNQNRYEYSCIESKRNIVE